MNMIFVWMLVIGGSGNYFQPSISNVMYADLPSCNAILIAIKNTQGYNSNMKSQCVKVQVFTTK